MTSGGDPASPEPSLQALRDEIDRIDRDLHARLIERGEIIDRLIAVKARQSGTSAFRPAREADMMRRLVTRHRGILPLATVESIWRIIISTFTYVQAPYAVHMDVSDGDSRMRDSARFHFGFTVPLKAQPDAAAVVDAVSRAKNDLGLIGVGDARVAWWQALTAPDAPKIIARLPFVERIDHAAGLPVFVVSKPLQDAAPQDVLLYAVERPSPGATAGFLQTVADADGSAIVAAPGNVSTEMVASALRDGTGASPTVTFIGSHAARFEFEAVQDLVVT